MTKTCGILAAFASVILAGVAVWFGALNQDEGWYLYAAQLVHGGWMPYRDFFYTQGPLMPIVYSTLTGAWTSAGLLGARVLTLGIGFVSIGLSIATVRLLVPRDRARAAAVVVALLLACNLYHLYFVTIPKTYALASLFVAIGFFLLVRALGETSARLRALLFAGAGLSLAFAAGTRISLGALLAVCGFGLLFAFRRERWAFAWFGLGGVLGLALVYGPFCADSGAFAGLCAAQRYHAARGGSSPVFVVGSLSRLVRWYLPVFILLGLAVRPRAGGLRFPVVLLLGGFFAVFLVQMCAAFPYEDYQVPIISLLAVPAAALTVGRVEEKGVPRLLLLTTGLAFALAFGSPLLEKWTMDGQDRFWTLKKEKSELAQLRAAAETIERLDPGGATLLTQDLYLAIETGRRVPRKLAMGPFSILSRQEWRDLLSSAPSEYPIAALSGYTFAVNPPVCDERPKEEQAEFWALVDKGYETVETVPRFGQNATDLEIMTRRAHP